MCRIHCLLALTGLLLIGCADTSKPTVQNPPAEPTTVTANKPPAGEEVSEGQTATEPEQTEEVPALDESLLPDAESPSEDATQRAQRELDEAGDAVGDWAAETKDKLVEKAELRLAELDDEIAKIETQAQGLTDDAKARWEENKQQLEEKRREFSEQLDKLKESGDEAWEKMAEGISKAWTELKNATQAAAAEFE